MMEVVGFSIGSLVMESICNHGSC